MPTVAERCRDLGLDPDTTTIGGVLCSSIIERTIIDGNQKALEQILSRIEGKIPDAIQDEIGATPESAMKDADLERIVKRSMERKKKKNGKNGRRRIK
jgi:hypothetical protein